MEKKKQDHNSSVILLNFDLQIVHHFDCIWFRSLSILVLFLHLSAIARTLERAVAADLSFSWQNDHRFPGAMQRPEMVWIKLESC